VTEPSGILSFPVNLTFKKSVCNLKDMYSGDQCMDRLSIIHGRDNK